MKPKTIVTLKQTLNPRHREFWTDFVLWWAFGASPIIFIALVIGAPFWAQNPGWESLGWMLGMLWMTLAGPFAGLPAWLIVRDTDYLTPGFMLGGLALVLIPLYIAVAAAVFGAKVEKNGVRLTLVMISFLWHLMGIAVPAAVWGLGV